MNCLVHVRVAPPAFGLTAVSVVEGEEMSVKVGLMQSPVSTSAADAANTNLYLENLLGQ